MKRIIVGVKDPAAAQELVAWAVYFARALDVPPVIVHAVQRSEMWVVAGMQLDCTQYVRDVRRRLVHEVMDPLQVRGIDATVRVAAGDPARVLADEADRADGGLILIGTSTHAPVRELLTGSVGHRLEHIAHVPLVVVPASAQLAA